MQLVQGYCTKHKTPDGTPMPKVDRGGEAVCMFCESESTPKTGITVKVDDPGDEQMRAVLKKAGIAVPPSTGKAPMPDVPKPIYSKAISTTSSALPLTPSFTNAVNFDGHIEAALKIMKNLPMPSDVKQFKAIHKIIAGMESLLGEK